MRRLIFAGVAFGILAALHISSSTLTSADTKCKKTDPRTGVCLIVAADPGDGGHQGDGTEVVSIDGSGSRASTSACQLNGQTIPCEQDGGTWSNSNRCYLKLMSDQPPKSDPAWEATQLETSITASSPATQTPIPSGWPQRPARPHPRIHVSLLSKRSNPCA